MFGINDDYNDELDEFEEPPHMSPEQASRKVGELMSQILAWRQKTEREIVEHDRRERYVDEALF
jgi:hypothetical protein